MNVAHILNMKQGTELLKPVGHNIPKSTTKPKYKVIPSEAVKLAIINKVKASPGCKPEEIALAIGFSVQHTKKWLRTMSVADEIARTMTTKKSKFGAYHYYDISDKSIIPNQAKENSALVLECIINNGAVNKPTLQVKLKMTAYSVNKALDLLVEDNKVKSFFEKKSGNKTVYGYDLYENVIKLNTTK